jgi:hypothetical protein
MIVQCIRCSTEFTSTESSPHICPNCHFVFTEPDSTRQQTRQASSQNPEINPERLPPKSAKSFSHRLLEEAEKCAFHPDVDALAHCRRCGRALCYACASEGEEGILCEPCQEGRNPAKSPPPPKEKPQEDKPELQEESRATVSKALKRGPYVPWEYRGQLGGVNAFFKTWRQSLFSPLRFFQRVPIVGDYESPLLYGLWWMIIGTIGGMFWRLAFFGYPFANSLLRGEEIRFSLQFDQRILAGILLFLISPLLGLLVLLGASALYHVFVMGATRRHAGFQSTLRVVCYSSGTNIFFFLPFLGALLGGVWQLVLVTVGLREMHRVAFPTAVTIALIPYTVFLVVCLAFFYWAVSGYDFGILGLLSQYLIKLL